jgi:hypothetical protein
MSYFAMMYAHDFSTVYYTTHVYRCDVPVREAAAMEGRIAESLGRRWRTY